jgi:hypothetical protein
MLECETSDKHTYLPTLKDFILKIPDSGNHVTSRRQGNFAAGGPKLSCLARLRGEPGPTGTPGVKGDSGGTVYTRWGRSDCPESTKTMLFSGNWFSSTVVTEMTYYF